MEDITWDHNTLLNVLFDMLTDVLIGTIPHHNLETQLRALLNMLRAA